MRMKCFYHSDLEAVATCQRCGKGLCHECAEKHSPCMCDDCARVVEEEREAKIISEENEKKQKYLDALIDTKKEFIKACVIGAAVMLCLRIPEAGPINLFLFFIPFGWKLLTYLQSMAPIFLVGNIFFWIVWIVMKAILSIIIGIPAFIYQLIKTFSVQSKINSLK